MKKIRYDYLKSFCEENNIELINYLSECNVTRDTSIEKNV